MNYAQEIVMNTKMFTMFKIKVTSKDCRNTEKLFHLHCFKSTKYSTAGLSAAEISIDSC